MQCADERAHCCDSLLCKPLAILSQSPIGISRWVKLSEIPTRNKDHRKDNKQDEHAALHKEAVLPIFKKLGNHCLDSYPESDTHLLAEEKERDPHCLVLFWGTLVYPLWVEDDLDGLFEVKEIA